METLGWIVGTIIFIGFLPTLFGLLLQGIAFIMLAILGGIAYKKKKDKEYYDSLSTFEKWDILSEEMKRG